MNQGSSEAPANASLQEAPDPTAGHTLSIVAGDDQTASLVMTDHGFPMATFDPVAAELRDAGGAVLAGLAVAWSVGESPGNMGVQMDPMGTSPCVVLTDEHGVATLDKMRGRSASAFYDYGPFTLVARHGTASVAAHMAVAPPLILRPTIASGDNQSVARSGDRVPGGEAVFAPIRILLKDSEGTLAPGVPVVFEAVAPKGMTVRISPEGERATVTSDAQGVVTLDLMGGKSMVCSGGDGEFKVVVTPDNTKPIVSHHTVES
jgi:hypothetical protein